MKKIDVCERGQALEKKAMTLTGGLNVRLFIRPSFSFVSVRDRTPDFQDVRQVLLPLSHAQIRHPQLGSRLLSLCFSRCVCKGLRKLETSVQMVSKVRGTDEIRQEEHREEKRAQEHK